MKKTKKLLACLIAAATMFTMGSTAFAADTTPTDQETVTVKKVYMLTNEGTTSPAETFTLEQVGKVVYQTARQLRLQILKQLQVLNLQREQQLLMEQQEI